MEHSEETFARAIKFGKAAQKLGFKNQPLSMFNYKIHGDVMMFLLANKESMVVVYCTPYCYLVMHGNKNKLSKEADYLIIKNTQDFLKTLLSKNFEFLTEKELKIIQDIMNKDEEREPGPEDLKNI